MSTPPKITVFIVVLTAHLAILAFAFPHLEFQSNRQASVSAAEEPVSANDASPAAKSADSGQHPNAHTHSPDEATPVDHHSDDEGPLEGSASDPISLAEQTSPKDTEGAELEDKSKLLVAVIPTAAMTAASANLGKPAIEARLAKLDASESPAEPISTAKAAPKPATVAKVDKPIAASTIPAQITTAKPTPKAAVVRSQPAPVTSNKAGAGRMSNLRPLSTAGR